MKYEVQKRPIIVDAFQPIKIVRKTLQSGLQMQLLVV